MKVTLLYTNEANEVIDVREEFVYDISELSQDRQFKKALNRTIRELTKLRKLLYIWEHKPRGGV